MKRGFAARGLAPGLLGFWGCWFGVVTASNVTAALAASGVIARPRFASPNFELVVSTTAIFEPPRAAVWVLFLGLVGWEAIAAVLYWRAALAWRRGDASAADLAALFGAALFASFMLADEACIAYALQATHARLLVAQLVSWLVARASIPSAA